MDDNFGFEIKLSTIILNLKSKFFQNKMAGQYIILWKVL